MTTHNYSCFTPVTELAPANKWKKGKIFYAGLFLSDETRQTIKDWWLENVGDLHSHKEVIHHITTHLKPLKEDVGTMPLGDDFTCRITGIGSDNNVQAVFVEITTDLGQKANSHITMACGEEGSPKMSNDLAVSPIEGIEFVARMGYFGRGKCHDKIAWVS